MDHPLVFDSEPDRKRQKPQKLSCICCRYMSDDPPDQVAHLVYIVDLSSPGNSPSAGDGLIRMVPSLRVDPSCFDVYGFCVLRSTLYMFQSYNFLDAKIDPDQVTSVAKVELSDYFAKSAVVNLQRHMLGYTFPMHHPKARPKAIPTPDGKILVYSYAIRFDLFKDPADQVDFELYDPDANSWFQLPAIHNSLQLRELYDNFPDCFYVITLADFINDYTLLVQTDIGLFSFDLRSPDTNVWEELNNNTLAGSWKIQPPACSERIMSIIQGGICFTYRGAIDIETPEGDNIGLYFEERPLLATFDYDFYSMFCITLSDGDGDCQLCLAQTSLHKDTGYPHLAIDVFQCDLVKYREDKQTLGSSAKLSIRLNKSFKFLLDDFKCQFFISCGFFPVSA